MEFIALLKKRFINHPHRHKGVVFEELNLKPILPILKRMEDSGGEVDVFLYENEVYFVDFSKESPLRRSLCYDEEARLSRKQNAPTSSVVEEAQKMGVSLLDAAMYKAIQEVENLDLKTSSWLHTPNDIRKLGGALFGDKRYNTTFIYHNGADSYYSSRGFRGYVKVDKIHD